MLSTFPYRSACWPSLWPGKWGRYQIARHGTRPDPRVSGTLLGSLACVFVLVKWRYKIRILPCHIQMIEPNQAGLAPSALDEVRFYCTAVSPYPHHHPSSPQEEWGIIPRIISEWIFSMRWIWNFFNYTTLKPMPFLHRFCADLGSIEAPGSRQSIPKLVFLEATTITMRLWIDIHQEDKHIKTDSFHHFWTLTSTDFVTIVWVTGDPSKSWHFVKVKIWMASCGEQPQQMNLRSDWKRRDAAAPWGFVFWWEIHGWIFFLGTLDFQQTIWAFVFYEWGHLKLFFPQQLTNVSWKE